ncbi:MAG: hypothetical protein WCD18_25675 [Thermosynechococcaceae cyanobacterium]
MVPLYGLTTYVLLTLGKYWKNTPKPVRTVALGSVIVLFGWAAITAHASAQALLFNKLFDALTKAMTAWGVPVPQLPNWMTQGLKMIALVIVVPVFVRLLRSRDGEEDETSRAFGKIMKVIVILGLGDATLSLFDV